MISGMAGIMFKQLGWIVSIIMIVSTTAALTLVPMLCSIMLSNKPKTGKLHLAIFGPVNKFLDWLSNGYGRFIAWCMKHKVIVLTSALAVFVLVMALLWPRIKTEYFPKADQGRLSITVELPIGTAQSVTADVADRIYRKIAADVPEIKVLNYRYGQADTDNAFASMQANGAYLISMNVNLGSMENRERSVFEIADIIRKDLATFPEIRKATVTEGGGGMGGATTVTVEVYGYDFDTTEGVAKTLRDKMFADPSFTQVNISRDQYTPEYQVDFDREKLALNGLSSTFFIDSSRKVRRKTTFHVILRGVERERRGTERSVCRVHDAHRSIDCAFHPGSALLRMTEKGFCFLHNPKRTFFTEICVFPEGMAYPCQGSSCNEIPMA